VEYRQKSAWWREWPLALVLASVALIYGTRLTELSLRGEETRRGQIAVEMMRSGDWIVPRQQGEPFLSRPPLQNWLIALIGLSRGTVDAFAIRLPTLLSMLLLSGLLYAYGRTFLPPLAAMVTCLVFATMGQVLELGRLGETDVLLTFCISAALLLWHLGRRQSWPTSLIWCVSYAFVALATLAKGPQGLVYFTATIGLYLLLTGQWRDLFRPAHAAGICLFLVFWGAWQLPFYFSTDWNSVRQMYSGDVALRFEDSRWSTVFLHLVTFPGELLLGCLLPWSLFLAAYCHPTFRRKIGPAHDQVLFLTCCLLVTFPTCWFVPGARARYFLPLYPCIALLVGLVLQRVWEVSPADRVRRYWQGFQYFFLGLVPAIGLVFLVITLLGVKGNWLQPLPLPWAVALAALSLASTAWLWVQRRSESPTRQAWTGMAIALFLGITSTAVYVTYLQEKSQPIATSVAELKTKLPPDAKLYSFNAVHHAFAYFYGLPISRLAATTTAAQLPADFTYFCFGDESGRPVQPGFAWREIAVIPCDRNRTATPTHLVHVGEILKATALDRTP
jgi:4-amino-4-deoxy-L-arabinose transferase-like glycosyltransferase